MTPKGAAAAARGCQGLVLRSFLLLWMPVLRTVFFERCLLDLTLIVRIRVSVSEKCVWRRVFTFPGFTRFVMVSLVVLVFVECFCFPMEFLCQRKRQALSDDGLLIGRTVFGFMLVVLEVMESLQIALGTGGKHR